MQEQRFVHPQIIYKFLILAAGSIASVSAQPQQPCTNGVRIDGVIRDPAGALISGAHVQAANGEAATTDTAGRFVLPCVSTDSDTITVEAEGFATATSKAVKQSDGVERIDLQLSVASVATNLQVNADSTATDDDSAGDTSVLSTNEVQRLADDPDDFLRQLQVLASASGGDPTAARITVNGFQNASALPPKDSIASIRANPDLFSSQYEFPPFGGGLIEIVTKPGADTFHGALFFTDSDSSMNATDAFSLAQTPAGKRRYGFDLGGPIIAKKNGFFAALEKRDIEEFNVVNAVGLDANDNQAPLQQTVAAPQRLWIASVRGDWQATPSDVATLSFGAHVNNLGNLGVGGLTLQEAGYASLASEYDLQLTNMLTLGPNLLHQTRIGFTWKRTEDKPNSTNPALQVAGFFNGGGATTQGLNNRERDLEMDDDVLLTRGKHEIKLGAQSLGLFIHDYDPDTFNGSFVFGGGSAPILDANNNPTGQNATISGIEQYRRALLNLPGGTPTSYQLTSGIPLVPLTQWRLGLYAQDLVKLTSRLTLLDGLRYQFQSSPTNVANFTPRVGLAWALDKQSTWVFHLRAGLFRFPLDPNYATEVDRLNGIRQKQSTIYSPSYNNPLTPAVGSIEVSTIKEFPHSLAQQSTFVAYFNAEHDFPQHWHARGNLYWGEDMNNVRIRNINAPLVASSIGAAPDPTASLLAPRPIAPGENVFQYQNTGHLAGDVISFSIDQHSYKRFGLYARYAHMHFKSSAADNPNSPQSSYSDQGESARVDWLRADSVSFLGNVTLPYRLELSTQLDARSGAPYDVTTGTDNNGDGDFNDRPSYASAPGPGVYSTQFGLLTANTVNGNVPRNLGTMPGLIHLDTNLSRAFILDQKSKDHPRTLTFNARSANLLNHTNVTAVNTVLSSSSLGQSLSAEPARRIEVGVRFAF